MVGAMTSWVICSATTTCTHATHPTFLSAWGREALVPVTGEGMLWTLSPGTGQWGAELGDVSVVILLQGMAGLLRPV